VTSGRFCGTRHGFESGYAGNKIDDDQSDQGFWNDHDGVSEISHAVIGKCLFQSSKQEEGAERVLVRQKR
jgi:hypothetical protein